MGILNATPDSFYAGSRVQDTDALLQQAGSMLRAGASILDLGGASTRPGAGLVPPDEELRRILPALESLSSQFPDAWISIDTYSSEVAQAAVEAGASIVNDVSGGDLDAEMLNTVASLKVPYIAMHMQGIPATMQSAPHYSDVVVDVFDSLRQKMHKARSAGITDLILDVGFGFGKNTSHNFTLLRHLSHFRALGCPLLAGISRKGMVWRTLGTSSDEALNGSTALHMAALMNGASILRVHDVKEAMEAFRLYQHYAKA